MSSRQFLNNLAVATLVATVYLGAAKLGLALAFVNASTSPVWPPTGVAIAALLLLGPRAWPGIFIGAFIANLTTAGTLATSLAIAAGNTLEGVAGAWLARRYANGLDAFMRATDVFRFVLLAALLAPIISATIGVSSLGLGGLMSWDAFGAVWLTWWLGDAVGAMIVAPFLVLWGQGQGWRALIQRAAPPGGRTWLEAALLVLMLLLVGRFVFGATNNAPLGFTCIPVLIWASFRFGPRAAATIALLLSAIAIWGTLHGQGPFYLGTPNESLLVLQAFIGMAATMSLILAAAVAERAQADAALQHTADRLRHLREIDQSILTDRPLSEIAQTAVGYLWNLLACTRVSVMQVDMAACTLTLFATRDKEVLRVPTGFQAPLEVLGDSLEPLLRGQTYTVPDVAELAKLPPALQAARVEHVRRYCYVPIIVDGELVGVLGLGSDAPGLFSTQQLDIAGEVADQLSIAMQQTRLRDQIQRHAAALEQRVAERTAELQVALARMEALYTVTRTAIASEQWPAALQQVVELVATVIPADRVSLIIFHEHEQRVNHFIHGGPGSEYVTTVSFEELLEGLTGWVMREGRSAHSPKGMPDPRESAAVQRRRVETNCGAIVVAPLRYQDQVLGTITAINRPDERDFLEADIELIEAIAGQVTIAHVRATLYERLQHATARLAGILDIADDAIIAVNARQEIELFNQGAERIFGYTAQEVIGRSLDMLLPAQIVETHRQHIQTFAASPDVARRMGERRDIFGIRRDGTEFPAEASISKLTTADGSVFTVILRDITARKHVETRLRASVREKEILLQEVHHRVKNNLQIIKSLLRLQAYTVGDPVLHELFRDSQNRVHAMALVHEQLYRAPDLAHVDCVTYLRELATSVLRSYILQSSQVELVFDADEAVTLDIDTAIPLGLILTELVSNSVKHAFGQGQRGTITVELHADAATLVLTVRDDGIGLPEPFDLQATGSLGLQLVSDLGGQLGGTVTTGHGGGAVFQICIPRKYTKES
jgi:PAS domain S-box-containing protein